MADDYAESFSKIITEKAQKGVDLWSQFENICLWYCIQPCTWKPAMAKVGREKTNKTEIAKNYEKSTEIS